MDGRFDIIDAFVDGEPVDPAALKSALADAEGRDYLVDAWLLRNVVQDEMAQESVVSRPARTTARRSWLIAAAVAGICLVGGYVAGTRFPGPAGSPAPGQSSQVETAAPPVSSFPVPPATRVIRLELEPTAALPGAGR
jgi:hypothetical protein